MNDAPRYRPLWHRLLDYLLHPIVLLLLLGVAVYSEWTTQKLLSSMMEALKQVAQSNVSKPITIQYSDVSQAYIRAIAVSIVLGLLILVGIARFYYATLQIRRAMDAVENERDRVWSPAIEAERVTLRETMERVPAAGWSISPRAKTRAGTPDETSDGVIYVRGVELENIRCFEHFGLSFEDEEGPYFTTILLGDNAAGKSTILRSIALGLCPESDAVSLIKGLPGSFLRKGASRGSVQLHVRSTDREFSGSIRTSIEQTPSGEVIRQVTDPLNFPWARVFVCGYGTHRSSGRPSSHQAYAAREAVGTLFSDSADLLNPEVVLLRRDQETRQRLALILKQILLLEGSEEVIQASDSGIELGGPWGSQPLSAVSDGYRSTTQWVLDYLGWQLFANRLKGASVEGVLLIDELEQHLHPRWQRYFVQRLRAQFPQTQIIASSHTPLLAAGVADVSRGQVLRLIPTQGGSVEAMKVPNEDLTGKRADQILTEAFGLVTSKSPGSVAKIDRYTELMSRERSTPEQHEVESLKKELDDTWFSGDNKLIRFADKAVSRVLDSMIDEVGDRAAVDAHVKQRLGDLFSHKDSEQ